GQLGMSFSVKKDGEILTDISLKVPGMHNVMNCLSAFACGYEHHAPTDRIKEALESFKGTDRRFEYKGLFQGAPVYDDYAHHPNEIQATLTGAFSMTKGTLWCVFQPHTYTRTRALSADLASALALSGKCIVTDIYAAREKDTGEIHSKTIVDLINQKKDNAVYIRTFDEITEYLRLHVKSDDIIIVMGAGDIEKVGELLTRPS
ncbi:MAG TPA: UDP-N-acetylmuramate--L-alanine ligase, partial [Clostridiales bacterium]|nr:UDP-N-acetylmuramate--L-alanine ligase [Clostridiales bacterium]